MVYFHLGKWIFHTKRQPVFYIGRSNYCMLNPPFAQEKNCNNGEEEKYCMSYYFRQYRHWTVAQNLPVSVLLILHFKKQSTRWSKEAGGDLYNPCS